MKTKTCLSCHKRLGVGQFSTSNKLKNGLYPWCKDCIAHLRTYRDPVCKAQYVVDYQKSYHASRRERTHETATHDMVREITKPECDSRAVIMLRNGIFETDTWRNFRDSIIKPCAACREHKQIIPVAILSVHLYPEFIFCPSNYVCLCVTHVQKLPETFSARVEFLLKYTKFETVFVKEYEQSMSILYIAAGERYAKGRPYTS